MINQDTSVGSVKAQKRRFSSLIEVRVRINIAMNKISFYVIMGMGHG